MKKRTGLLTAVIFLLAFIAGAPLPSEGAEQSKCPVLGGTVNKRVYADYQGKRIYFCCPPCIMQFQKDPDKYMEQMKKQGIVPQDAPQEGKVRQEAPKN